MNLMGIKSFKFQISQRIWQGQRRLLKEIDKVAPDVIVVTGDLIDRRKYDLDTALVFIKGAVKIAPVYYVLEIMKLGLRIY